MASENSEDNDCVGSFAWTDGTGNLFIILVKFGHKKDTSATAIIIYCSGGVVLG